MRRAVAPTPPRPSPSTRPWCSSDTGNARSPWHTTQVRGLERTAARHGRLHPRPHRPRARSGRTRTRAPPPSPAPVARRAGSRLLRPLPGDRRLQRRQRPAVQDARLRYDHRHYPDVTYDEAPTLDIGGERFELHHALGETDTGVGVSTGALHGRDMFIWASPNCGNPRRCSVPPERRSPCGRWPACAEAAAARPRLADRRSRHGRPGADDADLLDSPSTRRSPHERRRPPRRGHPQRAGARGAAGQALPAPGVRRAEFVVRNVWRLYGGWYDGNPATLKPAPEAELARELADLAGAGRLAARRRAGGLRRPAYGRAPGRAGRQAAPDDAGVHRVRAEVFGRRAHEELSTMAKGVFSCRGRVRGSPGGSPGL